MIRRDLADRCADDRGEVVVREYYDGGTDGPLRRRAPRRMLEGVLSAPHHLRIPLRYRPAGGEWRDGRSLRVGSRDLVIEAAEPHPPVGTPVDIELTLFIFGLPPPGIGVTCAGSITDTAAATADAQARLSVRIERWLSSHSRPGGAMTRSFHKFAAIVVAAVMSAPGTAVLRGAHQDAPATDSRIAIDVHDAARATAGTTFFSLNYGTGPRVLQVDMSGNVIWEYAVPAEMLTSSGNFAEAEYLPATRTVLIASKGVGVFEITYDAPNTIIWSYRTARISHDADRLSNGNTLFVWGMGDSENDNQVTEVDRNGNVVWTWAAKDHSEFNAYRGTDNQGWTHANAVERLPDGNTMISLRNFQQTVVVNAAGNVVNAYNWQTTGGFGVSYPHDPEYIAGSPAHVLVALQNESPYHAVEVEWPSGNVVWTWRYSGSGFGPTRDADRLLNGNTLLQSLVTNAGTRDSAILEVTPSGEVVWQLRLVGFDEGSGPGLIYKAQRVADPCSYSLSSSSHAATAAAGSASVSVTAGGGCTWSASSSASWLTASPASGSGSGTVGITWAANTGAQRTGTVTIAGQTFTVTQAAGSLAPANLTVGAITGNTVSIAWTAPSGATPTGYVLEGGVAPGQVLASMSTGSTATSFTFTAPTGAFYICIRAVYGTTRSDPSNEVRIYVNVPAPPSAPSGLLGLVNGSALALSWRNTATGGTPTSLRLTVSGTLSTTLSLPVTETFTYATVPAGTYTFTVSAVNATGTSSASNAVTLTFPGACSGAPGVPTSFAAARSGRTISVTWAPPASGAAVTGYRLAVTGASVATIPTTSRALSGAVGPGSYTLSVAATNPCGTGAATTPQTLVVP